MMVEWCLVSVLVLTHTYILCLLVMSQIIEVAPVAMIAVKANLKPLTARRMHHDLVISSRYK